jgi:hypothetical protein
MGDEERERRRTDEPDVEAHYRPNKAQDEGAKEPEDKSDDDAPDVEAHYRPNR